VVRAYKQQGVVVGRVGGLRISSETNRDIYRLRTAGDASIALFGYSRGGDFAHMILGGLMAAARLILPVLTLLSAITGVFLYRDTPMPVPFLGLDMPWLTAGHLLVPAGFFCVFLTNRRYGPAYAFAQIFAAFAAILALVLFAGARIDAFLPLDGIPTLRDSAAFGGAFLAAGAVSIVLFDCARGPHWWTAPLMGFLGAALVFPPVFFAVSLSGTAWLTPAVAFMGVLGGEGLLLLVPFWLMRRIVPPVLGFGGY
jgi:uncharacterized PurR-regulated membrane protein YhhQ (DUF165 family)